MSTPQDDEIWNAGRALRYLNSGGIDFGITRQRLRRMILDPECQIRALSGGADGHGGRSWFRLLASTVRAERARLLDEAGRDDPERPAHGRTQGPS